MRGLVAHEVDLAAQQIRHRRSRPLVGHRRQLRADRLHEKQAAELQARWDDTPISPARLVAETWAAVRDVDHLLCLRNTRTWPDGVWELPGAGSYLGHSGGGGVGLTRRRKYASPNENAA